MPREMGFLITTPHDGSAETVVGTLQCAHCSRHWTPQVGSGIRRGFCVRCMKPTCGRECCDPCVPHEQWLENVERGMPADYRPIRVVGGYEASPAGVLVPSGTLGRAA
jgi:hypothetical protein